MSSSKRSALHFFVLVIFAISTTLFLLSEANKAITEINKLSTTFSYLGVKK